MTSPTKSSASTMPASLLAFAESVGMGEISMWSLGRDQEDPAGALDVRRGRLELARADSLRVFGYLQCVYGPFVIRREPTELILIDRCCKFALRRPRSETKNREACHSSL